MGTGRARALNLGEWRKQFVGAARANDVNAMRSLISDLGTQLRGHSGVSEASPQVEAKSWQELCGEAQNEQDPGRLLKLVTEINRLLEEEQNRKRMR